MPVKAIKNSMIKFSLSFKAKLKGESLKNRINRTLTRKKRMKAKLKGWMYSTPIFAMGKPTPQNTHARTKSVYVVAFFIHL